MNAKEKSLGVMLLLALLAFVYEAHRVSTSRELARSLQQRQAQSQSQIEQLTSELNRLRADLEATREQSRGVASLTNPRKANSAATRSRPDSLETNGAAKTVPENETDGLVHTWADAAKRLQERFEQTPSARIPEMQFLNPADWLEVARSADLESETDYREAMGQIRKRAEEMFTKQLQAALGHYQDAHNDRWPADLDQLKSYFSPPVDDAILQRWQIVPSSDFPGQKLAGDWALEEKSTVDPEFDWWWIIDSPSSGSVGPYHAHQSKTFIEMQALAKTFDPAIAAYKAAHNGNDAREPSQWLPYATDPAQAAALQRFIQLKAATGY